MTSLNHSEVVLSILIVNFNGMNFLGPCLDSIEKNITFSHETIVVDNASQDGSVEFIKQSYPEVILVVSEENIGFTGGNNLAAKHAKGRYLLLLNNDTFVRSDIDPLIAMMDARKEVGAMGCRLFYGDGSQQESAGYIPSAISLIMSWTPFMHLFPRSPLFRRTVSADSSFYESEYATIEWVSGAFLLTHADLWRTLGGLDERYFMYMEDTDYCRRVIESGRVVAYSAICGVTHFEGAGRTWLGERAILNTTDSYLVYTNKFYGIFGQLLLRLFLPPVFLARVIAHGIAGLINVDEDGLAKAKAYGRASLRLLGVAI